MRIDTGSLVVMGITLILFIVAIFTKGMVHDLLLEAGVFLVSVKLLIMAHNNFQADRETHRLLEGLRKDIQDRSR